MTSKLNIEVNTYSSINYTRVSYYLHAYSLLEMLEPKKKVTKNNKMTKTKFKNKNRSTHNNFKAQQFKCHAVKNSKFDKYNQLRYKEMKHDAPIIEV